MTPLFPDHLPAPTPSALHSPPEPSRSPRHLASATLVGLALLLGACSDKAPPVAPKGPAEVGVVTLRPERQTVTTELPGRTSAYLSAEIRPQVGGIVQQRLFTEGAQVKAGQPLYQLDASSYQVALASAEASLAKAQANVGTAEVNARRNAELVKIDAVSRQVHDDSQAALVQTRSDLAVARAALDNARINLGYTRIKAPIAGRTTTSTVTPGALVTANQAAALTTISQLDPLYVDVTQSSTEVLRLKSDLARGRIQKNGQAEAPITLQLEDGSRYPHTGKLQFAGVSVNPGTGAVTLRAVVPNPDGLLMPGMYVRAVLETGINAQALLVPQQGVNRDTAGNASVLLVTADDKIERRKITVETAVGNRWLVGSGLAAGDRVVVDGFQRIKPGDTVKPTEVAPKPMAAPASAAATPAAPAASAASAAR
ncbi:efflux RND transporter periplasmic adaptor subunit [Acidovorax soli]|uniref:efflux RND transporter periplasmic adaptor subunit n=1 Tax=Acidovorax soli TaxID=592050 RepID=UPI0032B15356